MMCDVPSMVVFVGNLLIVVLVLFIIITIIIIIIISSPSARCSTVANNIYQFMDAVSTKAILLDDLCYAI
jgi:type III secretory pathway component EscV